jgi:peptidoglycan/LPS O-acetylase OafA/YrhL
MARLAAPVGLVASFTFTIYLLHLPLLKFFAALGGTAIDTMVLPVFATLLTEVLVGVCTEWRVRSWRSAFTRIVNGAEKLAGRAVPVLRGGD